MGMVELEPLDDADEVKRVHALIVRHHQYTGSARRAAHPRPTGTSYVAKFVKVMPTEYRRCSSASISTRSRDMARLAAV